MASGCEVRQRQHRLAPYPVKIAFEDERIKDAMLHGLENPFRSAYVVDVEVETINGRPVLYKVIRYHERFDKPELDTQDGIIR